MMECFFVMEAGVRAAESNDSSVPAAAKAISKDIGSCYEKGIYKLGKCLAEQENN